MSFVSLVILFAALFGCAMVAQKRYLLALIALFTIYFQINYISLD
jgi:hypothetical protein